LPIARPRSGKPPLSFSTESGRRISNCSGSGMTVVLEATRRHRTAAAVSTQARAATPRMCPQPRELPASVSFYCIPRVQSSRLAAVTVASAAASATTPLSACSSSLSTASGAGASGLPRRRTSACATAHLCVQIRGGAGARMPLQSSDRDLSVRECAARSAVILPVSSLIRPRRNVSLSANQLPRVWQGLAAVVDGMPRAPEYISFL
jgi:hypothetical protein